MVETLLRVLGGEGTRLQQKRQPPPPDPLRAPVPVWVHLCWGFPLTLLHKARVSAHLQDFTLVMSKQFLESCWGGT